jgi:deoxyribose-phosphate aldolase
MSYRGEACLNRYLAITNVPSYKVNDADNEALCLKAEKYRLAGILVSPTAMKMARQRLAGTGIPVGVTISYPSGAANAKSKAGDIQDLAGADAFCMVLQIGKLRDGKDEVIREELGILEKMGGDRIKMALIESGALAPEELQKTADMIAEAHIDWVVSGTGFKENMVRFSTVEDIRCLSKASAGRFGVAAMGGIETREQALMMLNAGAQLVISEKADCIAK